MVTKQTVVKNIIAKAAASPRPPEVREATETRAGEAFTRGRASFYGWLILAKARKVEIGGGE